MLNKSKFVSALFFCMFFYIFFSSLIHIEIYAKQDNVNVGHNNQSFINVSNSLMFWNFITFILLLISLKRYAWPKIISYIDLRQKRILDDIEAAKVTRIESQKLYDENKYLLGKALEEKSKILEEAHQTGEKIKQNYIQEAIKVIEEEKKKSVSELELKSKENLNFLKIKIVKIILSTVKTILNENKSKNLNLDYVEKIISKNSNILKN